MHTRLAVLVASLAAAPISWPAPAAGSPQLSAATSRQTGDSMQTGPTVPDITSRTPGAAPDATWDTFTADVTIRRRLVKKDGTPGLEGPEMRYRWVRTLDEAGWKTTMTVLSVSPDTIQTSKGPQAVSRKVPISRIEIGDAHTPTRVFDLDGRMVFMLPTRSASPADADPAGQATPANPLQAVQAAARAFAAGLASRPVADADVAERAAADLRSRAWADQLMPSSGGRIGRRAALARDMGSAQGAVRGLERFVATADGATTEVLSDPAWAVPVEVNVARDGALVSHTILSYEDQPGIGLVRRHVVSEQLVSPESGDRAWIDFEMSNVRLGRRVAR